MNNNRNVKKKRIVDEGEHLANGITVHLPKGMLLILHGEKHTLTTAKREIAERVDYAKEAIAAYAHYVESLQRLDAKLAASKPFIDALKATILAMYQSSPATLADFGLTPKKPRRPLTSQENLQRAVNANATRAARHTMGKRQKEKITGTPGTVVVVSPPPDESAPAPAPAPASAPAPAPAPAPASAPAASGPRLA